MRMRAAQFVLLSVLIATTAASASATLAASCDPNWSPKFSQITINGFDNSPASVRQITEQQIAKFGGVDQSIREVESEEASYQQQLTEHQDAGDTDAVNQLQQLIQFSEGMLDILRCRQQISAQTKLASPSVSGGSTAASSDAGGSAPQGNAPQMLVGIDIRYSQVDSRPLNDAEMGDVRNSLRWEPETVPLVLGGAAHSYLVDDKGGRLGSVLVRWDKPTTTKATQKNSQNRGYFTIQIENDTSCVFQSSAELDDGQGFNVVSGVTWAGWLTLHQPERGQTSQVKGEAALPQANPSLVLKPLTPYSTLSACKTPNSPGTASPATAGSATALPATTSPAPYAQAPSSPTSAQRSGTGDSAANSLVGTWTIRNSGGSGTYQYLADGSMSFAGHRDSDGATVDAFRGHWSLNGDSLTLVNDATGQSARITIRFIDDMHLEWTFEGHPNVIFERAPKN